MNAKQTMQEVEADFTALRTLPGEIRTIARQGVADLTKIRDDIKGVIATLISGAGGQLAALQALAADEADDVDDEDKQIDAARQALVQRVSTITGAPIGAVADAANAHATATLAGTDATAAATSAALAAGVDSPTAAAVAAAIVPASGPSGGQVTTTG